MSEKLSAGTARKVSEESAPLGAMSGLLDKRRAAEFLGVCVGTLDNMRRDGQIKAVPVRSRVMYDPRELARYIEAQKEGRA